MAIMATKTRRQSSNLPAPSLYTGSYDDAIFSHTSPQLTKPISIPHSSSSHNNKRPSFYASFDDDNAVLDDSDAHSEDELPPSPSRRHSGAMSISHENLSSCFDREALRRETAAHQRRAAGVSSASPKQQQQPKKAFAAHEQWDCEVDGPHMALWTPESSSPSSPIISATTTTTTASAPRKEHHQVSFIEGPMMCLWEP